MKSFGTNFFWIYFLISGLKLFAQSPYDVVNDGYKPEKRLVHDFAKIFSPDERAALENKLVSYDDSTSVQIAIITFQNLENYPIELLANEIGEKWGVGQKDKHNGIVIVFAKDERKVTLRGGYGIQAKMPPTVEKLIIDREMIPSFREGNFYQGFDNAINAIQLQIAGQYQAEPKSDYNFGFVLFTILVLIIFLVLVAGGGHSGNRGGGIFRDIILTNSGRTTWGSGGSFGSGSFGSGGGFGGFGGGSFGGGGASGSW